MTLFGSALLTLLTLGQAAPTAPAAPAAPIDQAAAREFLLKAKIKSIKTLSTGVTRPRRVTLTDGTLTHDAVFQIVDESKAIERFPTGRVEIDFRDSWHFNIAAFELARAIGLEGMVPAVRRTRHPERARIALLVGHLEVGREDARRAEDPAARHGGLAAAVGCHARLPRAGGRHRPQPDQHADHRGLARVDGGLLARVPQDQGTTRAGTTAAAARRRCWSGSARSTRPPCARPSASTCARPRSRRCSSAAS